MQLRSYSDFTSRYAGLVGIPYNSMTDAEKAFTQGYFNTAMRNMWEANNWMDVCPYGEARLAGNLLTYANTPARSVWTKANMAVVDNAILNPVDGRITAASALETAATGLHNISQTFNQVPATNYVSSAFLFPNGRRYLYLWVVESTSNASHFAILDTQQGIVSTVSTNTGDTASITLATDGFYLCQLNYVSGAYGTAGGTATMFIGTSDSAVTNPASASFAGNTGVGFYQWGPAIFQVSNNAPGSALIAFDQTGESVIEMVVDVWATNPSNTQNPVRLGYTITPDGIQILGSQITGGFWNYPISTSNTNFGYQYYEPVYLWFRKQVPDYQAEDYDASLAYVVDDQTLFENSKGVVNFYKCIDDAAAGYSPESQPTYWELLPIPSVFFLYAVYSAYADWLRQDGQMEKGAAMDRKAESQMDTESDRQERQFGLVPSMRVQSYLTSQPRF